MRSGITSIGMWAKTITVYSSLNAFNRSLGIDGRSEIYVALVDPDGTVHSLIKGDVTEAKVDQLRAAYPLISLSGSKLTLKSDQVLRFPMN